MRQLATICMFINNNFFMNDLFPDSKENKYVHMVHMTSLYAGYDEVITHACNELN